jgi:hypothetical protein
VSARAHLLRIHPPLDDDRLSLHPFEGSRMTMGRDPTCSVVVSAPGVSKRHARVERPRSGTSLRVWDLGGRNGTQVNGENVPARGSDAAPGSVIRLGEALFVYRQFTDSEADVASMPPLPGPLDTRSPALIVALQRVQKLRGSSGPVWVCGEVGSGRSVALAHLRTLAAEAPKSAWITGGELDFRMVDAPPSDAPPNRVLQIPSLRERVEDVPLLINRNLEKVPKIWPRLREAALLHDWPGNTQELRLVLRRLLHPRFSPMPGSRWDLPVFPDVCFTNEVRRGREEPIPDPDPAAQTRLRGMSRDALADALDTAQWRIFALAIALNVTRQDIFRRLGEVRLHGPDRSGLTPAVVLRSICP